MWKARLTETTLDTNEHSALLLFYFKWKWVGKGLVLLSLYQLSDILINLKTNKKKTDDKKMLWDDTTSDGKQTIIILF